MADAIEESTARFHDIEAVVTTALRAQPWECVVVGGGVRKPEGQSEAF